MGKTCSQCGSVKESSGFQARAASKDGLTAACKPCLRERDRIKHNKKAKLYCSVPDGHPAKFVGDYRAAWAIRNAGKHRAHITLHSHRLTGRITPMPCEVCGAVKVDAHHDDYTKPLDVRWLCRKHHAEHHNNMRRIANGQARNDKAQR